MGKKRELERENMHLAAPHPETGPEPRLALIVIRFYTTCAQDGPFDKLIKLFRYLSDLVLTSLFFGPGFPKKLQ